MNSRYSIDISFNGSVDMILADGYMKVMTMERTTDYVIDKKKSNKKGDKDND